MGAAIRTRLSLRARALLAATLGLACILLIDGLLRQHAMRIHGQTTLVERAGLLASLEAAALSVPMWNLDQDQLDAALDALAADPDFAAVTLLKPDGALFGHRQRPGPSGMPASADIEVARPIRYLDHGELRTLGTLRLALTTARLSRAMAFQLRIQAVAVAILLVTLLLPVVWALRQLIRPLDLLTSALERLAQGDLETELPGLDRSDEIGDVARALQVFRQTAQRLMMAEGQYRTLFDHSPMGIFGAGADGVPTSVNSALLRVAGRDTREAVTEAVLDGSIYVDRRRVKELSALLARDGGYAGQICEVRRPDGSTRWVSQTTQGFYDEAGRLLGFAGTVEDISDRLRMESQDRLRVHAAMQSASDAILITDPDGLTLFANPAFTTAFPKDPATFAVAGGLPALMADALSGRALLRALRSGLAWQGEAEIDATAGGQVPVLIRASAIRDDAGERVGSVVICTDLAQRRAAEARIHHMAHHDALTGLPNRVLFGERLRLALDRIGPGAGLALLCLDLDRFKDVNDTLGHGAGDALLCAVAARLTGAAGPGDLVARLGGDEFVVLQAPADAAHLGGDIDAPGELAARLIGRLSAPYRIGDRQVVIGISLGIALAPLHTSEPDELMRYGDMALYAAKAHGRGRAELFTPELDRALRLRSDLEHDLRRAVAEGSLHLHYQPQYVLQGATLLGAEALLRWSDPVRGAVSPAEFIPLAEECGLINTLGEWVLRTACRQAVEWPAALSIAVNLSPVQFRSGDLVGLVAGILAETGLEAARLELEITEGVLLGNSAPILAMLGRLKALGVRIAMDDFGTGYSSLSYLSRMPIDKLKIDQSFTRALGIDGTALPLVRSIIGIAHDLGLVSLAEGVETDAQAQLLRIEGCVQVQGYLYGRPMSASSFKGLALGLADVA